MFAKTDMQTEWRDPVPRPPDELQERITQFALGYPQLGVRDPDRAGMPQDLVGRGIDPMHQKVVIDDHPCATVSLQPVQDRLCR
jgi:hypothetical protein